MCVCVCVCGAGSLCDARSALKAVFLRFFSKSGVFAENTPSSKANIITSEKARNKLFFSDERRESEVSFHVFDIHIFMKINILWVLKYCVKMAKNAGSQGLSALKMAGSQ